MNKPQLLENANRVIRIIKDKTIGQVDEKYFVEDAEKDLYKEVKAVQPLKDYKAYLEKLDSLNPAVEKFFNDVLVMDKDENIKNNRISLLGLLKEKYDYLTDFSSL
ncbi:MAG: glycine--tRNA ligase subunit beta, partial [Cyanobacteriota bacterium]|nr:glycine--tRNA ligase subunit beta [Cyanobacteriota bacterium]